MAGNIETVVFDLGGVLVDWNPRYLYRKAFANETEMGDFLSTVATLEWHLEQDRGRTMEEATASLPSLHLGYAEEIGAYYGRWDEMFGGPIERSVDVLREFDARGFPLYAPTNWSAETFPLAGETYDFLCPLDEIVVSGEERTIKPDGATYRVLAERTGIDPATTVFMDDSPPNVTAARDLGFAAVTFRAPDFLREELGGLGLFPETSEKAVANA